jgi:hypothetical protein
MSIQEILLEEYKVTQESISHYERMIWNIGSIFNAIVIGILGLSVDIQQPNTLIIPIIVSIWFHGLWFLFETRYRQVNLSKFRRLWKIEQELGMQHNLVVREDDKKRKFKPRAHLLITFACLGFPATLIALYVILSLAQ